MGRMVRLGVVLAGILVGCGDDGEVMSSPDGGTSAAACDESMNVTSPAGLEACQVKMPGALYVGLVQPFSGPLEAFGQQATQPVAMALEEVNSAGGVGGQCVGFIQCDTELTAENTSQAPARLEELSGVEELIGIVGPRTSGEVLESMETIQSVDTPVLAGTSGGMEAPPESLFSMGVSIPTLLQVISGAVFQGRTDNATGKTALVAAGTGTPAQTVAAVEGTIAALDTMDELEVQAFTVDPSDSTAPEDTIQMIEEWGADHVVVTGVPDTVVALLDAAVATEFFPSRWYLGEPFAVLPRVTDSRIVSAAYSVTPPVGPAAAFESFSVRFAELYGQPPTFGQPIAYDAACLLVLAAAAAEDPSVSDQLRDALRERISSGDEVYGCAEAMSAFRAGASEVNYEGASSEIDFDAMGQATGFRFRIFNFAGGEGEVVDCITENLEPCE